MKHVLYGVALALISAMLATPAWADSASAGATVAADIATKTQIALYRSDNTGSANRGSPTLILFDKYDSDDVPPPPLGDGDPRFMYAPYREGEKGLNWHAAAIFVNRPWELRADVTGDVGGKPLKDVLNVWCGKEIFDRYGEGPFDKFGCTGDQKDKWVFLNGFTWANSGPFVGNMYLNYRLDVEFVNAGEYAGTVTYTLTSL